MSYSSLSCDQLLRACLDSGNADAWEEFVRRFRKPISLVIWRMAYRRREKNKEVIEDLIQDTFLKVCENNCRVLKEFEPQHDNALMAMLKVIAANVTRDYFRSRKTGKRGSGKIDDDLSKAETFIPDTKATGQHHIENEMQLQEIDKLLGEMAQNRDRLIFWFYYKHGYSAREIAEIPAIGLSEKGVESVLNRLKIQLRRRLAEGNRDRKALSQGEE